MKRSTVAICLASLGVFVSVSAHAEHHGWNDHHGYHEHHDERHEAQGHDRHDNREYHASGEHGQEWHGQQGFGTAQRGAPRNASPAQDGQFHNLNNPGYHS